MKNLPLKKIGNKFINISVIFFPLLSCFYIVSVNSNGFFNETASLILLILSAYFAILFILGIVFVIIGKDEYKHKFKKTFRIVFYVLASIYLICGYSVVTILYFPGSKFKDWLVTTAMTTMSHQYFATWFYDSYDVNLVLANNVVIESGEDTNPDLIQFTEPNFDCTTFENEFEKQVLTKEKGNDLYKIIELNRDGYKGKLVVVYDPSKVIIGVSKGTGSKLSSSYGQFIYDIAARYNAVIATNAGGFYDPDWNSTGGVPHGIVISQGKLIANNSKANASGGVIGFNKDNKLVLSRMSANQALKSGIRDAVDFGPFLIVNGKPSFVKGNGGWGDAPRTAIGQRADGIVLLAVIDGRQKGSVGADMVDLTELMQDYGAINASNLDGGTSTGLSLNGKIINNPRNGSFQAKTRPVPNAWLVLR